MAGPCRPGHPGPFRCATTDSLGRSVRRWAAAQSSPGCWVQMFRRGTGSCRSFQRLDSIFVRYLRNMTCVYVRNYRSRSAVPAAGSRQRYIVPRPWAWPDAPCRRTPCRSGPSIANAYPLDPRGDVRRWRSQGLPRATHTVGSAKTRVLFQLRWSRHDPLRTGVLGLGHGKSTHLMSVTSEPRVSPSGAPPTVPNRTDLRAGIAGVPKVCVVLPQWRRASLTSSG